MSNDNRKWLPYNLDSSAHECRESRKDNNKEKSIFNPQQKEEKKQLTLEDLDARLKK